MSYTLQLWEKPADWPWPATKAEADAQFERVADGPPTAQNPKFLAWGAALHARFPEDMDVWLDGSEEGTTTFPTLGFGINTRTPHWNDAFEHAWEQAVRLGLNLYDPQSGVHYLGNGDTPEEPDLQVLPALRAREAGDDATAWAQFRRLAAAGNPHARHAMGRALRFGGMNQRRHFDLAAALQLLGAQDIQDKTDAQAFYLKFSEAGRAVVQALLARLKAATGEAFLQLVDGERQTVDAAFAQNAQKLLATRQRLEASDGIKAAALQGHEVAAFACVLESVIGWEEPSFENARYWCQRAVDWDHEPAKRLLALMHEQGWGGPVDLEQAAKWNAAAREQAQQAQQQQARQEAGPGGLSLAPMTPSPAVAASAPLTGVARRDLVGWFAREGNPHAACDLGLADEHGRDGAPVDLGLARAWYAQAAEAGHADASYNLGVFIEAGRGGPGDALAAKALFMLANSRGTTMRVDDLRLAPSEQGPVRALANALREPGRLRAVLQERGLAPDAASPAAKGAPRGVVAAAASPQTRAPSRSRSRVVRDEEDDDEDRSAAHPRAAGSLHLGHLALAIGAANAVLLIAFARPGASFRTGMFLLGLVAAFGAWRTGRDFGWSALARAVVAVLATIPLLGMAVSVWLLLKSWRGRE